MISLVTSPPAFAFDGDEIPVEFISSLFIPGRASVKFDFTGNPADGEAVTLNWEGNSITLTAANSPDNSGNQFPTNGTPLADYVDAVRDAFLQNEILLQSVEILRVATTGVESVVLNFPINDPVEVSSSGTLSNCTVTATSFAGLAADNLRAIVRVYKVMLTGETYTGSLHALYNTTNLRARVNVAELLNLAPEQPSDASITAAWSSYTATQSFAQYYFRYADKYGFPAVAEALQKSTNYNLVAGSVAHDTTNDFFAIFRQYVCHNYAKVGSASFPKIVTHEQPDYFFFIPKIDLINHRIHAVVTWSDGTVQQHVLDDSPTLNANTQYYFPSGFTQLGLNALTHPTDPSQIIIDYKFAIGTLDIPGDVDSFQSLVDCSYTVDLDFMRPWTAYLLCFNGVGGTESFAFFGKTQRERQAQWREIELEDSTRENFRPRTRWRMELNSGYFDAPYIEHLQQLLTGKLWYIDLENNRYLPVRLITQNIELPGDDADPEMNSLTIEIEASREDEAWNDY